MIHLFGRADEPVPRLLAALAGRGHRVDEAPGSEGPATLALGPGPELDELAIAALLGAWSRTRRGRLLVLSLVGAHPDARAPRLRRLWQLEERARGFSLPVLTLRLAPMVGPSSPLWRMLRSRPPLGRAERLVVQPVAESDVLETLERALDGRAAWEGWYEVAGPEPLSLGELAGLAHAAGPAGDRGAWEPPLEEMAEHRLCESAPWSAHFGLTPTPIGDRAGAWVS